MGNIVTKPLSIEEFEKLDLPRDRDWELHNGELVGGPLPSLVHKFLQHRIWDIFRTLFPDAAVLTEFPFQIRERMDIRSADIGVANRARLLLPENRILDGAPDLVVEVLSPSNSVPQMKQYRRVCFEYGTSVFLEVDSDDNTVDLYLKDQKLHRIWECGEELPIALFGREVRIPVREIFG